MSVLPAVVSCVFIFITLLSIGISSTFITFTFTFAIISDVIHVSTVSAICFNVIWFKKRTRRYCDFIHKALKLFVYNNVRSSCVNAGSVNIAFVVYTVVA